MGWGRFMSRGLSFEKADLAEGVDWRCDTNNRNGGAWGGWRRNVWKGTVGELVLLRISINLGIKQPSSIVQLIC